VKLTVVGCSPAWPNAGSAQSGYLVEHDGGSLLLECGPGVLARLRCDRSWPEPHAIVITHFHLDHWGDLVPWVWGALHFADLGQPPRRPALWVPPGGIARLEHFGELLGFPDMFERVFALHEYTPDAPFTAGGCELTATAVPHYRVEAYGLRVSDGNRTLAYSGDSGPAPALATIARDADLFLCEATLERGELDGEPRGHLSLDEARAAFDESGAHALVVTHRPSELESPDEYELAHDGMVLEV